MSSASKTDIKDLCAIPPYNGNAEINNNGFSYAFYFKSKIYDNVF